MAGGRLYGTVLEKAACEAGAGRRTGYMGKPDCPKENPSTELDQKKYNIPVGKNGAERLIENRKLPSTGQMKAV